MGCGGNAGLIDGAIDGKPRKLLAQASRNGYYFLLDRTNGEHIVTEAVHRYAELGERVERKGTADSGSGQVSGHRWRAGITVF